MKVHFYHKIFSLTMALLMFASTAGISMDVHYCQDKAQSKQFYGTAKNCYDKIPDIKKRPCQLTKKQMDSLKKKPCCHNDSAYYKAELEASNNSLNSEKIPSVVVLNNFSFFSIVIENEFHLDHFFDYRPPLVHKDILTQYQHLLI